MKDEVEEVSVTVAMRKKNRKKTTLKRNEERETKWVEDEVEEKYAEGCVEWSENEKGKE